MTTTIPGPQGIRHHWMITLQWGGVNSSPIASIEGTFTPAPGQTRQQAFRQLRDHAIAGNEDAGHRYPGEAGRHFLQP